MTRLTFVRHAETDMAGRFCGHSDPLLNQHGRIQLVSLIQRLEGEQFQAIYTSDLARARQTADAIAVHFGVEVHERRGLREIYFGEWEGLCWTEIESHDPEAARRWVTGYPHLPTPGGETWPDFQTRVFEESEFLRQQALREPILAVTHAGFLRVALPHFQANSDQKILELASEYASVTSIADRILRLPETLT
jgi:alpha-ribazole phosphatase/probable phosphoglycerate mutase